MIIIQNETQLKAELPDSNNFGTKGASGYFCTPKKKRVDLVAQLVEHITFNDGALGSSPSGITVKPEFIPVFLLR